MNLSKKRIAGDKKLNVTVDITNNGDKSGTEIIQLYIRDVESSVERPLKELKGFKKIKLKPNEKQTIKFEVTKEDLSFFDENNNCWKAEKGLFNILIGSSSRDIRLQGEIKYLG